MATIFDLRKKYLGRIAPLDLELLFSLVLNKSREFVLAHPEYEPSQSQIAKLKSKISRRIKGEPIAYLIGKKEFYGLDFKVNQNTLIPRPETELLVEMTLNELRTLLRNKVLNISVIDVGTGSGNIIISLAHNIEHETLSTGRRTYNNINLYGTDISSGAITIAKQNARRNKLDKKIKFFQGDLLNPLIGNWKLEIGNSRTIVLANLPYLSSPIYARTPKNVKNYEPKTALYSPLNGLSHYIRLLKQIALIIEKGFIFNVICYMEISPEQRPLLQKIAKKIFPSAKISFHRDLAGKWRVCQIEI